MDGLAGARAQEKMRRGKILASHVITGARITVQDNTLIFPELLKNMQYTVSAVFFPARPVQTLANLLPQAGYLNEEVDGAKVRRILTLALCSSNA